MSSPARESRLKLISVAEHVWPQISTSAPDGEKQRRRRGGARLLRAGLLVIIAALVVGGVLLFERRNDLTAGPVVEDGGNGLAFSAVVGEKFAYGVPLAYNDGDETAVLIAISLANPSAGLELVETRVAGPKRKYKFNASSTTWPSDEFGDLRPVSGYKLEPRNTPSGKRGVELVFVMRADRVGSYTTIGAVIDYRVGDRKHRVTLRNAMRVCVEPKNTPGSQCRAPDVPPRT